MLGQRDVDQSEQDCTGGKHGEEVPAPPPADAPAPAAAPAPTKPKKKASTTTTSGPSVGDLIIKIVSSSEERNGISAAGIKKALASGGYAVDRNKTRVNVALKKLVGRGTLVQTSGTGASGSFKMSKNVGG